MKFHLLLNTPFDSMTINRVMDSRNIVKCQVNLTPTTVVPFNAGDPEEIRLCDRFRKHLFPGRMNDQSDQFKLFTCDLEPALPTAGQCIPRVCLNVWSGSVTRALSDLFGSGVKMQVGLSDLVTRAGTINVESSEMELQTDGVGGYVFEDPDFFQQSRDFISRAEAVQLLRNPIRALITVTVSVPEEPKPITEPVVTDKLQVFKKMLLEEIGSDLVIISGNGKEVKAHKGVLGAHSDVFKAMFQSDMKEAKTSTLEMRDMSEEGVRGLLAFLYCWEETEPNAKPEVAFEMLQAGHKYDIPVLEAAMKKLLLDKPEKWFDVETAMKLFRFARNLPKDGDELKMKAVKSLKEIEANLMGSPTCVTLFKEDSLAALEFSQYALRLKP